MLSRDSPVDTSALHRAPTSLVLPGSTLGPSHLEAQLRRRADGESELVIRLLPSGSFTISRLHIIHASHPTPWSTTSFTPLGQGHVVAQVPAPCHVGGQGRLVVELVPQGGEGEVQMTDSQGTRTGIGKVLLALELKNVGSA